jgi:hypothetical protein
MFVVAIIWNHADMGLFMPLVPCNLAIGEVDVRA